MDNTDGETSFDNPKSQVADDELRALLEACGKLQYLENLAAADIYTIDTLASTELETLCEKATLPKMVGRMLLKKVVGSQELLEFMRSIGNNKQQYVGALLNGGFLSIDSILEAKMEDLPVPKMIARLLKNKGQEYIRLKPLRELLTQSNQIKHLDVLVKNNIITLEDIRDLSVEELAVQTGMPKMVARNLHKKVVEKCKPDVPDYDETLPDNTKNEIREVWMAIKGSKLPFGAHFYEALQRLGQDCVRCFYGVNIPMLGRYFDEEMEELVKELDDPVAFSRRRDALVSRLVKYKVPPKTLWLGSDAFYMACVATATNTVLTKDPSHWNRFFYAIVPPLHPFIIRSLATINEDEWDKRKQDFFPQLHDALARRGYLYFANWLREKPSLVNDLWACIQSLRTWQNEKGLFKAFTESCQTLLHGINSVENKIMFLIELPHALEDRIGRESGTVLGNILLAAGISMFGIEPVREGFRALQRERVGDQWSGIYRFSAEEFGERFYDIFQRDPRIAEIFQRTDLRMQKQRFVHQMNAVLIRINEDMNTVLRPMLIDLGARHRVYYQIGSSAMSSFLEPFLETVKEMLGRSHWRNETSDAWAYVTKLVLRYMMLGWTCGAAVLERSVEKHGRSSIDFNILKELRDTSEFELFFVKFSASLESSSHLQPGAAQRYKEGIDRLLDDDSGMSSTLDRIQMLGRRHHQYHGVTATILASAAKEWMRIAAEVFKSKFSVQVASEWAILWGLIASSMSPQYISDKDCPTVEELLIPFRPTPAPTAWKPAKAEKIKITLQEKISYPNDMVILRFSAEKPIPQKAGQFAKLRATMPNGKPASRFYSIASCPDPKTNTTSELEFFIKEVKGGKVSPWFVNEINQGEVVEVLTTAGNFVLPETAKHRLMVSAGVGLVAFMSAIRSVVARIKAGLQTEKLHLSLIHSERHSQFPFLQELLDTAEEYGAGHELFFFDFTFCCTGLQKENEEAVSLIKEKHQKVSVHRERVSPDHLSASLSRFQAPSEVPVYACGPAVFQKAVRETFLKKFAHSRSLIHLEFFDL